MKNDADTKRLDGISNDHSAPEPDSDASRPSQQQFRRQHAFWHLSPRDESGSSLLNDVHRRTDSILSRDSWESQTDVQDPETLETLRRQQRQEAARHASIKYMEQASMETSLIGITGDQKRQQSQSTPFAPHLQLAGQPQRSDGSNTSDVVMVQSEDLEGFDDSQDLKDYLEAKDGETAAIDAVQSLDLDQSMIRIFSPVSVPIGEHNSSDHAQSSKDNVQRPKIRSSSPGLQDHASMTPPSRKEVRSSKPAISQSAVSVLVGCGIFESTSSTANTTEGDALHFLFDQFCEPPIDLKSIIAILNSEEQSSLSDEAVPLPDQATINLVEKDNRIAMLLSATIQSRSALLTLPIHFTAAFLRILVRILTHESDDEYRQACMVTSTLEDSLMDGNPESPAPHPDHSTNRPDVLYNSARFQCTWSRSAAAKEKKPEDDRVGPATVLRIWESLVLKPSHQRLVEPLARLLGVLSIAGISPRLLRQMFTLTLTPSLPTRAKLAMIKCLTTAAVGAARPMVLPKVPPPHFFLFGGQQGIKRTITGLPTWPFRNDFGVATWFRAEQFGNGVPITLFSARVRDGAGISISLVPLDNANDQSTKQAACVVQISVFDSGSSVPSHQMRVSQCVLLPRVWYYLAVRHTRSRLKGVFSLSTRQQMSIILDGKVMHVDSLPFPIVSEADLENESILQASLRRATSKSNLNLDLEFGAGFDGQTGAVYVFHDNVSDASLRALYEVSGGNKSKLKRSASHSEWDSRRSDIVRKSRALDKKMTNDDADEIVLGQRRASYARRRKMMTAAVDLRDSEDTENSDVPSDLQWSNFGSKVFIVWDPSRTIGNSFAIESHLGAHFRLEYAFCWSSNGAQDIIASIGGIQSLVPIVRAVVREAERETSDISLLGSVTPRLLTLLASFVVDHDENAREFLRCGALEVVEQVLMSCRQTFEASPNKPGVLLSLTADTCLSRGLVRSILQFRSNCEHYVGLETKVFSRLLFNVSLWVGSGATLDAVLMPVLASLTRRSPGKVRDCLSLKEVIQAIHDASLNPRMSAVEVARVESTLLGIVFDALAAGTSPRELAPFLNLLSVSLDAETWETLPEKPVNSDERAEARRRFTIKSSTMLYMLFQVRPVIPGLFESFSHCCGSVQGGVAWIMSAMVNSVDDSIRSLGIRCIAAYLEVTSTGPDSPLTIEPASGTDSLETSQPAAVSNSVRRGATRLSQLAKDLAMGPAKGVNAMSSTAKLTTRVVFKLMWHLLRSLRAYLGAKTRAALIFWITHKGEPNASAIASLGVLQDKFVIEDNGFRISLSFAEDIFAKSGSVKGKSLRDPFAVATVLRVLRFLDDRAKDEWLLDLLHFATSNRTSVSLFTTVADWQVSLFHLLSDTLEAIATAHRSDQKRSTDSGAEKPEVNKGTEADPIVVGDLDLLNVRLDHCLDLFAALLAHMMREGGEKALGAVEAVAALVRVTVNGHTVFLMVMSRLCANLFENGTLLEIDSISAEDWKDVDLEKDSLPLKQSARRVTDAILSNGTQGLDLTVAVRCWRSLRHLTEIAVALVSKNGLDVANLFDYRNKSASAVDEVSRGLHGIRLSATKIIPVSAVEYGKLFCFAETEGLGDGAGELVNKKLCVTITAQVLVLLDAFMFPASLDASLPASQLHGLTLVRDSEPRLGLSQGPLLCSAVRLSIVLLSLLEPSSVAFLQCASRLRCLLYWALELRRENGAVDLEQVSFRGSEGMLDRLILASVLHCHRSLSRCSALLLEIESAPFHRYFKHKDEQKKHQRRILRASLELRDIAYTAFRGRSQVLQAALSSEAYEELKASLESGSAADKSASKESFAREFLSSGWVAKFQDTETRADLSIPEQVAMDTIPLSSNQIADPSAQGFIAVENLAQEAGAIVLDYEKALNSPFENYLESQRKWAETDAVRDLEYEGDNIASRLSNRREVDAADNLNTHARRRNRADFRWNRLEDKCVRPWKQDNHWKLAEYTDRQGRRIQLAPNLEFDDHHQANYEGTLGAKSTKENTHSKTTDLTDVMRRNADAFITDGSTTTSTEGDTTDDESSFVVSDSENSGDFSDGDSTGYGATTKLDTHAPKFDDFELDAEWDKIGNEELDNVGSDGDIDGWAKAFIWGEGESVVARFEPVMIVSLRSFVLGKILLTTNGVYFRQIGDEINGLTKEPVKVGDVGVQDAKDKRWRLSRLTEVHGRRYMLRQQALELFFSDSYELFLNFPSGARDRDRFYAKLRNTCKTPLLSSPKSLNPRVVFRRTKLNDLWKKRKISNFEYLMALNRMAGRSFNDITQYPVMPWVLADYTSDSIDLTDSRVYRDLSKPIGALNPNRLAQLLERYNELELFGFTEAEKFLYGSHYSSPGIVLHYLIRQEPFTSMAIDLQSGRFDCPDRLFFDVAASWNGCLTSSSDMKELIPEFYSLPEMFLNTNKFPLGTTQAQISVDNVRLPPWAKGSAYEFVRVNRLALESAYVSQNLNHWIDLIFGFKQRGTESEAAHNIFHHLSYEGSVDLDKITDEVDRIAAESHVQNFGQTPSQLIVLDPHTPRFSIEDSWRPILSATRKIPKLRCYTAAKQFANNRNDLGRGGILKLQVLSDTIVAVFGDMSVGTYKWHPKNRTNRLRMDKIRPLEGRLCTVSRAATKRGSAIPPDLVAGSGRFTNSNSVAVTLGGRNTEELRRKATYNTSRLMTGPEITLSAAEAAATIISCGYWDNCVRACDIESLKVTSTSAGGHRGPIRCLAVGADGAIMVTGGQDCTCRVWVIDHPDMAVALSDGYMQTALGMSNDGADVLTCCHVLWGHETPISAVAVNSNLDVSVSGDLAGKLCVHTLRRGEFVRYFNPPPLDPSTSASTRAINLLALHSNGYLAIHAQDKGLHMYTINAVRLCSTDAEDTLHDIKFTADGERLITGGDQCQVRVRCSTDLCVLSSLDLGRHGPIRCITLTPEELNPISQYLFIGGDDGMITIVEEDPTSENNNKDAIAL